MKWTDIVVLFEKLQVHDYYLPIYASLARATLVMMFGNDHRDLSYVVLVYGLNYYNLYTRTL